MPECRYDQDCRSLPIREHCLGFCLAELLRHASVEEYELVLGLDADLSAAIGAAYAAHPVGTPGELASLVGDRYWRRLEEVFRGISQFQLDYLNGGPAEREPLLLMLRGLRSDMDTNEEYDYLA